jgi:pilus assembly protein FimV
MTRTSTTKTLLAAAIALQATLAQALGLGDISLRSALDEPLKADIRLRGVGDLGADQIIVNLASGVDFERAGVDRLYSLTEIRFEVELLPDGDGRIRLSTERPVREPYLDFVVEVRWPTGRVLREYTVLLDLPTTASVPAPAVRPAARAEPEGRPTVAAPRRAGAGGGTWTGGDSYAVQSGDTLWSIASRARPSGVTVQQMMVALQRENPDAFIRGNMNLLRAGAILRIPAGAAVSQDEALGEIAAQGRDWRSGGTALPEERAPAAPAPGAAAGAPASERAYLELATGSAAGTGAAGGGVEGGSGSAPLDEQLATVQENLSAKELENAELQSRVSALEEQVKNYERLVELKSEGGAAAQQAAGTTGTAAETAAPATAPAEAPAAPVAAAEEPGLLERLMGNTLALGGAIAALFVAALAFVFLRRRREESRYATVPESSFEQRAAARTAAAAAQEPRGFRIDAPEVVEDEPETAAPPIAPQAVAAATAATLAAATPAPAPAAPPAPVAPPAPAATAAVVPEHRDPVSEADILIAYGRVERAEEILASALLEEPDRADVRLKLMELQADRGDERSLLEALDHFALSGDEHSLDEARALLHSRGMAHLIEESGQPSGVQSLAGELELPEAGRDTPAPAPEAHDEPELARMEVDTDILHLDADIDLEAELAAAAGSAAGQDEELALELGELDFDGGLGETSAPLDELAAELDLEPGAAGGAVAAPELELDLDLGEAGAAAASAPEPAQAIVEPPTGEDDADLGLLEGSDEIETKLELARAYVDMGDLDGARDILDEVVAEGSDAQRGQATALLERIRSA